MPTAIDSKLLDLAAVEQAVVEVHPDQRLVWRQEHVVAGERFRLLAHRIRQKRRQKPVKTVLITSAVPEEGKTRVAANLAVVLTRHDEKVLLMDADLRGPDIHHALGLPELPGLSELLADGTSLQRALRRVEPLGIYCLQAGSRPENPMLLLEGPELKDSLMALQGAFDWVIIDSPPLNPFADAHCLAAVVDAVLLVVRWNFTPRQELDKALAALRGLPLMGLVLNEFDEPRQAYYYSHYKRCASGAATLSQQGAI